MMTCSRCVRCVGGCDPGAGPVATRWTRVAVVLLAAALAAAAAGGDEGAEYAGKTEHAERAEERLDLTGRLRILSAVGTASEQGQQLEAMFEPEAVWHVGPDLTLHAIGRMRVDALDELEPGDPPREEAATWNRRAIVGDCLDLELRELYAEAMLDRALLNVGKQQIVWGQADGLKVLDVVNPQDFRAFILESFADSRIPLWAVNLEVPVDPVDVQLVWLPDQTYHDLPEDDALFAFTSPHLVPRPPPGVRVVQRPPDRPRRVIADSDAGVRLSTFQAGWDLTFNYLYHYDDTPVFQRRPTLIGGAPAVVVTPTYRRTHLVGGTFSRPIGATTVRGELGAFLDRPFSTSDPADGDGIVERDELRYVLGLDWFGLEESLISFQLFQSVLLDDDPGVDRDRVTTDFTLLLRHEMLNDTLVVEMLWLLGLKGGDGLVRPKVRYAVDDRLSVWLGLDLFYGGGGGVFGQFDANDRVVLGAEWRF